MGNNRYYKYYQPNKMDVKDKYGDCVIRSICKALECDWKDAFDMCLPFMIENQCLVNSMPLDLQKKLYKSLGFDYVGISNKKGSKRPTVMSFAKEHMTGTYILNVANHQVTVKDGCYWDTWDSGECCLYGYFIKGENE